ncbi:MAG: protein kinase [Parachlamydiaceae bacterium]|nr:protein kinase [Parachlamydiaceae bacterium]
MNNFHSLPPLSVPSSPLNTPIWDDSSGVMTLVNTNPEKYKFQLSEEHQTAILNRLKNAVNPHQIADNFLESLKCLDFSGKGYCFKNDNHPVFLVFKKCLYILQENIGNGSTSKVSEAKKLIITRDTPIKDKLAIKEADKSFSPEFRTNQKLRSKAQSGLECIDMLQSIQVITNTSNDSNTYIGVYEKSEKDFSRIDYRDFGVNPLSRILPKIQDLAVGLKTLHAVGLVHRDIKGLNCLMNSIGHAKITDLEYAMEEPKAGSEHCTPTTPFYAAPFIWTNFINKLKSFGYQGKESDVFSFGRMLQHDIIGKMLNQLGEKYSYKDQVVELRRHIDPKIHEFPKPEKLPVKKFSKELLDALNKVDEKSPGLVTFSNSADAITVIAYVFPNREDSLKYTKLAIDLFSKDLGQDEILKWNQLAELAHDLLASDPVHIPCMETVFKRLKAITSEPIENTKKRSFSSEDESDSITDDVVPSKKKLKSEADILSEQRRECSTPKILTF